MTNETILIFFCLSNVENIDSKTPSLANPAIALNAELARRCKNGDRRAFNELMALHQKKVFNIMYRYCGNYEDAKDLTQDVFVKVFKSLKTLKEDNKFGAWIISIASNTYKNEYKSLKRRGKNKTDSIDCPKETEDGEMTIELKDCDPIADEQVHKKRVQKIVQDKINLLKDDYKEVIILRDVDGMEYEEISSALNISIGTVKSRIFRAREELRRELADIVDSL